MPVLRCSPRCCIGVAKPFLGVQFQFSAAKCRAITVHDHELHEMHRSMQGLSREKLRWLRGRIGEVPAPASRFEPFTHPLFAPAALNGNPALRGLRLTPQEVARHE